MDSLFSFFVLRSLVGPTYWVTQIFFLSYICPSKVDISLVGEDVHSLKPKLKM